ncbi:methionyl-tRNA formyltransferase [Lacisediminihabitans changchengi]|uniref:Methionyl-tRNA formyltransferase n=1 Tax=Lacisediminihabitans changchengi TaxID=2787634 RepID=A0A934SK51_9MICO|nr:methionyl-tRNA formyltransferase [Lacisediminihabitans changchengi]MBK4346795.1 methionyl-tRNA formyltransferase [Lacisediminihabitans changchengi]MBK4348082.1 methionyl-tRNA formyltransferase [Lacisediminihabitans changchengi]
MSDLEIVFAGSPSAAVPSLQALTASRHDVLAVLTREDSPQGRKRTLTPTAVAEAADALALPIIKANRLAGAATEQLTALQPDLGVIVAYGGLVREPLLSMPRLGWINLHFSLLPRWRGAAPVQRAIIAGDETTGASVFQLVPELDAGDLYGHLRQPIGAHETAGHLLDSLSLSGAELLVQVIDAIADGDARPEPQVGEVTLAPKLTLDDGRIDWAQPAIAVDSLIRGVTPEPGAFTMLDDQRLKVLQATIARDRAPLAPGAFALDGGVLLVGTASDPIELTTVHPAGKKPMGATDWWRGRPTGAAAVAS